ncbi:MAG: 2-succinyl-5-enolpyruvyl-6-hydroxy-3-cyclohexene-1-carboxylic-acid synthase [Candidatus Omnitrophica bacterium]|nr:2-succinyl-5-enolpyruvyl-6-hydroxy-3-cyclohexene-1-carboxylic-acid synthase [Candidatus Omnitrophota bacterium]
MPLNLKSANINSLWADLIIEELFRCGVEYFCVAPGSRSAPLAIAISQNKAVKSVIHFDERGLGFHALGLTAATLRPTVVITTSGTAAANLFPSIIEASKKKLPLIIMTADRPPELRFTGANQTIDQIKIFGDHVRFFFDVPCPTLEIAPEVILTTINQSIARAKGELPGPIHLNCMFREPLVQTSSTKQNFTDYLKSIKNWQNTTEPYTTYIKGALNVSPEMISKTAQIVKTAKSGIIAVGKISGKNDEAAVLALAEKLNWPIFADVTSGIRLGHDQTGIIHHFDHILHALEDDIVAKNFSVDCVLHLGGRLTSNRWYNFIKIVRPHNYVMVLKHPLRNDPNHIVTLRLQSDIKDFCDRLAPQVSAKSKSSLLKILQKTDKICETAIQNYFEADQDQLSEPSTIRCVTELVPENSGLFIGNSMPIRDFNMFSANTGKRVRVSANRGASGIDGNIATAAGFAKGLQAPCTTVIGDIAFLHDINSLNLLQDVNYPFIIIVINNNGGAIFSFLPVANVKNGFDKFFTTPHNLTFEQAAKLFNLSYNSVTTKTELKKAYLLAIDRPNATIIEVHSDPTNNLKYHRDIEAKIHLFAKKS